MQGQRGANEILFKHAAVAISISVFVALTDKQLGSKFHFFLQRKFCLLFWTVLEGGEGRGRGERALLLTVSLRVTQPPIS